MKVIKYSEFNSSSRDNKYKYKELLEQLDLTYYDMKYGKKLPNSKINEGLSDIINALGEGFTFRLKNYAAGWLLQKMGLPADNNFFSEWSKNIVGLISFEHIADYFGEGSCVYWSKAILKGLEKTIIDVGITKLIGDVSGLQVNFNQGLMGTLAAGVRDTGELYLLNTGLNEKLVSFLEGKICGKGTTFTNIFGGGKVTPKQLQQAAQVKADPNKSDSDKSSSGILKLLGI